jgi:predicted pyridoxine 5'-phosphate oxidase superfamily flavin-nucleotide-binding protein
VPVGLIKALDDSRLMIVDVLFNKTRKNLAENAQVALAVTDVNRLEAYQLKGRAEVVTEGEFYALVPEIMSRHSKWRDEALRRVDPTPEMQEKIVKMKKLHSRLKPKAVVVMTVEEVHTTLKT